MSAEEHAPAHTIYRHEVESGEFGTDSVSGFILFIKSGSSTHGLVPLTFRVDLPISVNLT